MEHQAEACPPNSIPPAWYTVQTKSDFGSYIALPLRPHTQPIFLTAFQERDAEALQQCVARDSVNSNIPAAPKNYTIDDAISWITLQLKGISCLELQALRHSDPETGRFIGSVSLMPHEKLSSEDGLQSTQIEYVLGYYLHPDFQGRGFMRDAVLALLSWAVEKKSVRSVVVQVVKSNYKSRAIIESIGEFKQEKDESEIDWPESKGGGKRTILTWRLNFK